MPLKLIADSGSTKTEWCLIDGKTRRTFITQGLSPYFLSAEQVEYIIENELKSKLKKIAPDEVFFYGTGCSNPANVKLVKKAIEKVFNGASVSVDHDLMGAARALCGREKGVACILGTGSNSCYFNGKRISKKIVVAK